VRGVLGWAYTASHRLTSWPLSRVITVAPLLSLETLVTGAEGSAGMVLGDLAETVQARTTRGAELRETQTNIVERDIKSEQSLAEARALA